MLHYKGVKKKMNCIWILLLLCCCGNHGNANGCGCNNDRDCDCGRRCRRDNDCDDGRRRRRDNDCDDARGRRRDNDCDNDCDCGNRTGRVMPMSPLEEGCSEPIRRFVEEEAFYGVKEQVAGRGSSCGCQSNN